jgi:Zn-dependent M28 family amino/carboxypeptidase
MAQRLIAAAGLDFGQLKAAAARPDFRPVELHGTADFEVENTVRDVASHNVVAKVTGSDPQQRNDYVIYTAHWDHLGRDSRLKGDQIFHGAKDNASGTAALLELARAFAHLPPAQRPPRSILFLAVTAEEKGLLGSRYYAEHPLYPLTHTLADLNMDIVNIYGPTRDLVSVGLGASTLDDVAADIAREQSRRLVGEPNPERGTYYRSDHFEFAKVGVPACHLKGGVDLIGQPAGRGQELEDAYTTDFYHQVTDVIQPDWTMEGAVQEVQTLYELGQRVARAPEWPQWKPGNEFKARRDAMMSDAAPSAASP